MGAYFFCKETKLLASLNLAFSVYWLQSRRISGWFCDPTVGATKELIIAYDIVVIILQIAAHGFEKQQKFL